MNYLFVMAGQYFKAQLRFLQHNNPSQSDEVLMENRPANQRKLVKSRSEALTSLYFQAPQH